MHIKTIGLGCLLCISLIATPIRAMEGERKISDEFVQTTYARLYKNPNTREYALLVCCGGGKVIVCFIRFYPLIGLCTKKRIYDCSNPLCAFDTNAWLGEMHEVKILATENNPARVNLTRRGLNQLIETVEAGSR